MDIASYHTKSKFTHIVELDVDVINQMKEMIINDPYINIISDLFDARNFYSIKVNFSGIDIDIDMEEKKEFGKNGKNMKNEKTGKTKKKGTGKFQTNIINKRWKSQLSKARRWFIIIGIIPFFFETINYKGQNMKIPVVADIQDLFTGMVKIYCSRDIKKQKNIYYWSHTGEFNKNNNRKILNSTSAKYDSRIKFLNSDHLTHYTPYKDGTIHSKCSTFLGNLADIEEFKNNQMVRDETATYYSSIIERDVPKTEIELNVFKEMSGFEITKAIPTDIRNNQETNQQNTKYIHVDNNDNNELMERFGTLPLYSRIKHLNQHRNEINMNEMNIILYSKIGTLLGIPEGPWNNDSNRNMNDGSILSQHNKTREMSESELQLYQSLLEHWYYSIFGAPLLNGYEIEYFGKIINKRNVDYELTNEEIEILKMNFDLKILIERRPVVSRPNFENLAKHYLAGMITKQEFANLNTDLYGIKHRPVSKEEYVRGALMYDNMAVPIDIYKAQQELQMSLKSKQERNNISVKVKKISKEKQKKKNNHEREKFVIPSIAIGLSLSKNIKKKNEEKGIAERSTKRITK